MLHDPWLRRWLPLVEKAAGGRPVLEIGCGTGDDTSTLVKAGLPVVAFDISAASVAATRVRAPAARVSCQDVRAPFPLGDGEAGAVVASLTLHYFPWTQTLELVDRVRRTLAPGGMLLCRLNSTEDRHFGASGHPVIEPHYFLVDGQPKRFFDRPSVDALFNGGWSLLSTEHQTTTKYLRSKALWEVVAQKAAESSSVGREAACAATRRAPGTQPAPASMTAGGRGAGHPPATSGRRTSRAG